MNSTTPHPSFRFRYVLGGLLLALAASPTFQAATTPPATPVATNVAAADPAEELRMLFEKEESITNTLGTVLVWFPQGKYRVAATEVTQAEYEQVAGANPSKFRGARRPVERVSVSDAAEFCRRLTEREQADGKLPKNYAYQIPTEPEWDAYAAGTPLESAYVSLIGDRPATTDVGQFAPNPAGLYDVRGNVWEWCTSGVARGGSYQSHEDYLNLSFRFVGAPDLRIEDIGFRIILRQTGPG